MCLPVCEQNPCCHSNSQAFLKRHIETSVASLDSKFDIVTMCSVTVEMKNIAG